VLNVNDNISSLLRDMLRQ